MEFVWAMPKNEKKQKQKMKASLMGGAILDYTKDNRRSQLALPSS